MARSGWFGVPSVAVVDESPDHDDGGREVQGSVGTIAGIGVGIVVGQFMANLLKSFLPLPIWRTSFQFDVFAKGAVLGLTIPIAASALPLWRALRVEPIEAIRTGHLTAKSSRLTDWTGRIPLPGSSLTQIPIRNVLRTPRRTLLTAAGVAAALTALVAVLGMLDSFSRTIDRAGDEFTKGEPNRVLLQLDTFYPADSSVVKGIDASAAVGATDVGLRLPGTATSANSSKEIDLLVDFVDFKSGGWSPTLESSTPDIDGGIILARKAADDLGVEPGDRLVLQHPILRDSGSFVLVDSDISVTAIHANPLRSFAYMDLGDADLFGLGGVVNVVHAYPATGATSTDLQRAVFDLPGVASSQAVARISEGLDKALAQFIGFLVVTAVASLVLALLMAFNATRITIEERRREHATMQAFGLPVRTIVGVVVKESVLIGIGATLLGVAAGTLFLGWMLRSLASTTLPDIGIDAYLSPATLAIAAAVGTVAVAAAPLFLVQRIRRMDIPDTLRVME